MFYFELILIVLFVVLTIIGYKKSDRNIMLAGSICLVIAMSAAPFAKGFTEGFDGKKSELKSD